VGCAAVLLSAPATAAPPRYNAAQGKFTVPLPANVKAIDKLVIGAALDLRPMRTILESRYGKHATVTDFRQSPAEAVGDGAYRVYARNFSLDLELIVDDATARMALDTGKVVDARLAGRLVARRLVGRGGCRDGEFGYGVAMVVFQSPPKVRVEFGGFAMRLCVRPRQRKQCIVNALTDGRVVERCYPDVAAAEFDKHVCNASYLDRQRLGLTVPGAVACYHRWTDAMVRWHFDVLDGDQPTPWYRSFIRGGMRVFGAVAMNLIADRYRDRWKSRFAPTHGLIAR